MKTAVYIKANTEDQTKERYSHGVKRE